MTASGRSSRRPGGRRTRPRPGARGGSTPRGVRRWPWRGIAPFSCSCRRTPRCSRSRARPCTARSSRRWRATAHAAPPPSARPSRGAASGGWCGRRLRTSARGPRAPPPAPPATGAAPSPAPSPARRPPAATAARRVPTAARSARPCGGRTSSRGRRCATRAAYTPRTTAARGPCPTRPPAPRPRRKPRSSATPGTRRTRGRGRQGRRRPPWKPGTSRAARRSPP
mmetsp:Transcript_39007/g.124150  ORF Transcript_39007/g.124150 Transcript_39007/m.124150 type:complete len:225 (-) Transcript_39007:2076-2750(-)